MGDTRTMTRAARRHQSWHGARRALCKAQTAWVAWQAKHPRPDATTEEWERRWELRQELRDAALPAYLQAHLLRERLAEAQRQLQVEAILEAERCEGARHG